MDYDSKRDAVDRVIEQSDERLNEYAENHYNKLEHADDRFGDAGVKSQIRYMVSNIEADGQLRRKLVAIADGEDPDDVEPLVDATMTGVELEAISRAFSRQTGHKVVEDGKLGMKEFERHANKNNIAVEKVFVANPWRKSVLTSKAAHKELAATEYITVEY